MKKQKSKRGLVAMLFVTVLAIVIALSARMLKGTEPTYAASSNLVCKEGDWNSALGKCVSYSMWYTHSANTCNTDGTIKWSNSSNSTKAGWIRADQSNIASIANANRVQYYITPGALQRAGATNTAITETYYGNDGVTTLCKNVMDWRFQGATKNPVSITAKFRFYRLVDPVSEEPAGSMTYRQCTQAASKSNTSAVGSGSFTHCMQYTCTDGICTSKSLTNAYQIVCKNGNTSKYSSLNSNGSCRALEKTKDGISGTFYCTEIYDYDCNKTSNGSTYIEKVDEPKPTISAAVSSCYLNTDLTNRVGENIVQHCNSATCKGGVWSETSSTIGDTSLGCPSGYKRVDYSDGVIKSGTMTGECDRNGNVSTKGTCVDGSKRACVFKAHYMCVEDKTTYEDEKLKELKSGDIKVTGIPQYVKVGDEFSVYAKVPEEVSNFDKYKIQMQINDRTILNQSFGEYKLSSDSSVVVFPVKARKAGTVVLTIGVKDAPESLQVIQFDVQEVRKNDEKLGGIAPTCQIKVLDTAPVAVWSSQKYLKVELTNEATLSDTNPFLWNDGRTVESRAVQMKRDYSVIVTGLNGKTGECKITADELGYLENTAPSINNKKVTNNGVITFDAVDTGGSGLDYYYVQEPGKPVAMAEYVDENGYKKPILSPTTHDLVSTEGVRNYGTKFTSCTTDNRCSVTHNVRETGTYYIYVVDKAGNVSKQKVDVTIEGTPYIDEMYFSEEVISEPTALLNHSNYGSKLVRLSNNYQTDSLVKQLAFTFNQKQTEYNMTTASPTITLHATLKSTDKSFVKGFEPPAANTPLAYGANEFVIKVEDKKGRVTAYTIHINRIDDRSGLNSVESITVGGSEIDFNENITNYDVDVAKDVTQVSLSAVLKSTKAKFVDGFGPRLVDINEDEVTAELKIQSEAGSIRVYTITFHKVENAEQGSISPSSPSKKPVTQVKGSNYLSSLSIPGTNIALSKDRLTYNVYVPYTTLSVKIYAFAEDPQAKVVIDEPTTLRVGSNTATISVVSTGNKTRTYTVTIIRKEDELGISSNTKLGSLEVLGYDIGFDRNKTNYELKIDKEKNLFIAATPESDRSEVYIIGNEDLTTFSTVKLSVIAEDGSEDVYSVQISKDVWNLRNEIIITVAGLAVVIGVTVIYQVRRKKKLKKINVD